MRTARPTTYTTLSGTIIRETDKAMRFKVSDEMDHALAGEAFWFPLSQLRQITRSETGLDSISVADWLIETKVNEISGSNFRED